MSELKWHLNLPLHANLLCLLCDSCMEELPIEDSIKKQYVKIYHCPKCNAKIRIELGWVHSETDSMGISSDWIHTIHIKPYKER